MVFAVFLSGGVDSNIVLQELLKNKGTNFTNYSVTFKDSTNFQWHQLHLIGLHLAQLLIL